MSYPSADRNLLFGALALQTNFVSRDQLVAAIKEWAQLKSRPLGEILCVQGVIDSDTRALIEGLVDRQLTRHDGDVDASLQSLSSWHLLHDDLLQTSGSDDGESSGTRAEHGSHPTTIGGHASGRRHRNLNAASRYRVKAPSFVRGGLGELFLAEDTELGRDVVVKEIQGRWASDAGARERFVLEAEITGGLEHPGVVPVYGLGQYADGRPFYAMRFIKGDNLKAAVDRFHDPNRKTSADGERVVAFRTLIGRFIDVCNAVAYAHSRGVLHRDLKPANVMLGKYGETLVVDWGLAKTIGRRQGVSHDATIGADATLRPESGSDVATKDGQVMGSPPYMSPEQAAGKHDELGPATDVYSLGATLYTVLTGKPPYEGKTADVLPLVQQGKFARPRAVKPEVPEALEAICLTAMALEPKNRYSGPAELASDLEHWLADEPVSAWPEPWRVKAGRWVRRHRTTAVAAVVLLATATACLSIATWLVSRERDSAVQAEGEMRKQWVRAEQNFKNSVVTVRDMLEIAEDLPPSEPAAIENRKNLMARVAGRIQRQLADNPTDAGLRRLRAMVLRYHGNTLRLAHDHAEAQQCYDEATRLLDGLDVEFPSEEVRHLNASVLSDFARSLLTSGDLDKALAIAQRAVALMGQIRRTRPQSDQDEYKLTHIESLVDLSAVLYVRGEWKETLAVAQAASLLSDPKQHPGYPNDNLYRLFWGAAEFRAGCALRESGRASNAAAPFENAISLLDWIPGDQRLSRTYRQYLGIARLEYGRNLKALGKHLEAAESLSMAVQQFRDLVTAAPAIAAYQELYSLALQEAAAGSADRQAASEAIRDAVRILADLNKRYPQVPRYQGLLGIAHLTLAQQSGDNSPGAADSTDAIKADALLSDVCRRFPGHARFERAAAEARRLLKTPSP